MGKEPFSPGRIRPSHGAHRRVSISGLARKLWPGNIENRRWRWFAWSAFVCFCGLLIFGLLIVGFSIGLPDVRELRTEQPEQITRVFDRKGELIGEIFETRRRVVPLDQIPRVVVLSVLAAEDADFYQHEGMDLPGIVRVVIKGLMSGKVTQGASTITQQLVKNALLSPERTLTRKVRELILARRVEKAFTKDEILHFYLNLINFGHGRHGVQEAARFYFDKDAADLSLSEASLLAGIPKAPAHLSPIDNPEEAEKRRQFTLDQLAAKREEKWPDLSEEEIAAARAQRPKVVPWVNQARLVPEIVPLVRDYLTETFGEKRAKKGGFDVHTTLDLDLQLSVRDQLRKGLQSYDRRHNYRVPLRRRKVTRRELKELAEGAKIPKGESGLAYGRIYKATVLGSDPQKKVVTVEVEGELAHIRESAFARYNPDDLSLEQLAEPGARLRVVLAVKTKGKPARVVPELGPQGAVCVIDAENRGVLALVGGYSEQAGFNRATQALRQPGSTFKPLVFALALKSRTVTPASVMVERRSVTDDSILTGEEEVVEKGPVSLRKALAKSVNRVAVQLIHSLGPEKVADFARQMGVTSDLEVHPGLALGSSEVRVDELTNVYATFAAGGEYAPMRLMEKIIGPDGKQIPLKAPESRRPLDPAEAYLTTSLMESVITDGTGRRALVLQRPVAGKTGTSNDCRDSWFMGFSPKVVVGVWVGYDDFRPLGEEESGRESALPIWIDVMKVATADHPTTPFERPEGLVQAQIDPETGLRAFEDMEGSVTEFFLEGTLPRKLTREEALELMRDNEIAAASTKDPNDTKELDDSQSQGEPRRPAGGANDAPSGGPRPTDSKAGDSPSPEVQSGSPKGVERDPGLAKSMASFAPERGSED